MTSKPSIPIQAANSMAEFSANVLFSMGFTERLVNPRKGLDLHSLLRNLFKKSKVRFITMVVALRYMRTYSLADPANLQYSVYPAFVSAFIAASKFLEDHTFTNKTWSDITGFKLKEINFLEMHFLAAVRFSLNVPWEDLKEWIGTLLDFTQQEQMRNHPNLGFAQAELCKLLFESSKISTPAPTSIHQSTTTTIPMQTQQIDHLPSTLAHHPRLLKFHNKIRVLETHSSQRFTGSLPSVSSILPQILLQEGQQQPRCAVPSGLIASTTKRQREEEQDQVDFAAQKQRRMMIAMQPSSLVVPSFGAFHPPCLSWNQSWNRSSCFPWV